MRSFKRYIFNPQTLMYEVKKVSTGSKVARAGLFLLAAGVMSVFYAWIYVSVLGLELPKTAILRRENAHLVSRIDVLDRKLDDCESALNVLQMRDDDIYRSIFGLNVISPEVRNAGFGGVNRYDWLADSDLGGEFRTVVMRMDRLSKKTYVQSRSFDEVVGLSRRAGDMASCIPAIPPINPDHKEFRISSTFGYRIDPKYGGIARHTGVDFATKTGNPVYSTGDGVVESVRFDLFGYGNQILIDHGFGYKTRYAHLSLITVAEGMKIKRGECIGAVGNSGKSTGSHLHYEVIYRGACTNPLNYLDVDMSPEEYASMVQITGDLSGRITSPVRRRKK